MSVSKRWNDRFIRYESSKQIRPSRSVLSNRNLLAAGQHLDRRNFSCVRARGMGACTLCGRKFKTCGHATTSVVLRQPGGSAPARFRDSMMMVALVRPRIPATQGPRARAMPTAGGAVHGTRMKRAFSPSFSIPTVGPDFGCPKSRQSVYY
jgi:hypothetical protein